MSAHALKSCAVIALSLALLYSGVAWAMEACVRRDGHTDYAVAQEHQRSHPFFKHAHAHDSVPVLHCASLSGSVDLAVRAASTEIRRLDKAVVFYPASHPGTSSIVLRNDLWLKAVFRKAVEFFRTTKLKRHLILSIFQI